MPPSSLISDLEAVFDIYIGNIWALGLKGLDLMCVLLRYQGYPSLQLEQTGLSGFSYKVNIIDGLTILWLWKVTIQVLHRNKTQSGVYITPSTGQSCKNCRLFTKSYYIISLVLSCIYINYLSSMLLAKFANSQPHSMHKCYHCKKTNSQTHNQRHSFSFFFKRTAYLLFNFYILCCDICNDGSSQILLLKRTWAWFNVHLL